MAAHPPLLVTRFRGKLLVRLPGPLLAHENAPSMGEELAFQADRCGLVLDMAQIEVVTAAGLGMLASLNHRLRSMGGRLWLRNVRPRVREVLEVARMTGLVEDHPWV